MNLIRFFLFNLMQVLLLSRAFLNGPFFLLTFNGNHRQGTTKGGKKKVGVFLLVQADIPEQWSLPGTPFVRERVNHRRRGIVCLKTGIVSEMLPELLAFGNVILQGDTVSWCLFWGQVLVVSKQGCDYGPAVARCGTERELLGVCLSKEPCSSLETRFEVAL